MLPDRAQVTMTTHFLRSYSQLADQDLPPPRRPRDGRHGGADPDQERPRGQRRRRSRKVRADKLREVSDGHDGTWVAHPGLVPIALEVFDAQMPGPTSSHRLREDVHVTAADLLAVPDGPITEAGLRNNINVGVRYLESWLRGTGCVPIYNLMEDAATAEISRAQVWQWIRHPSGVLDDGRKITVELFRAIMDEELAKIRADIGAEAYDHGKFPLARTIFDQVDHEPDVRRVPDPARVRASSLRSRRGPRAVDRDAARHGSPSRRDSSRCSAIDLASIGRHGHGVYRPPLGRGAEQRWESRSALERHPSRLHAEGRRAGCAARCTSSTRWRGTGAERLWELLHTEPYVHALGALTGNQAVQKVRGRPEGDLPERLAGRGRRQHRRADVSRPEPLSRATACRPWCARSTTPSAAPTRSSTPRARTSATGSRRSWPTPRPASAARSTPSS